MKAFSEWLAETRNGGLDVELSEAMAKAVTATTEHHKVGSVTLTITIRPTDVAGAVQVADAVKAKVPEGSRQETFWFVADGGELMRNDPRQLEFRELRDPPAAPAVVDRTTEEQQ